jgi:hypothetical protein
LAIVQEFVEQGGKNTTGSNLSNPALFSRNVSTPKSHDEIGELAKHLAYSVVAGYLEHDRGHLDKSIEGFFQVYLHLFTKISPLRARRAAELYVEALVKQDEIENVEGHSPEQIANDPSWGDVRKVLLEFSRTLGIPDSYADETTDFFRYHGVRDKTWVIHCIESENIFMTEAIGNSYWSKMLGSLLIFLTDCHDKHDTTGLQTGIEFATKYFEIILRAKSSATQKAPVLTA